MLPPKRQVRRNLSGSVSCTGIKIDSTSTAKTIHTHSGTVERSDFDEVHLWAINSHSASVTLSLQWGGSTDPDNLLPIAVAAGSFLKVVDGLHICGDLSVAATATVVNKVMVYGYVVSHIQDPPVVFDLTPE